MVTECSDRLMSVGAAATFTFSVVVLPLWVVAVMTALPLRTPVTFPVAASRVMQPASRELAPMA